MEGLVYKWDEWLWKTDKSESPIEYRCWAGSILQLGGSAHVPSLTSWDATSSTGFCASSQYQLQVQPWMSCALGYSVKRGSSAEVYTLNGSFLSALIFHPLQNSSFTYEGNCLQSSELNLLSSASDLHNVFILYFCSLVLYSVLYSMLDLRQIDMCSVS